LPPFTGKKLLSERVILLIWAKVWISKQNGSKKQVRRGDDQKEEMINDSKVNRNKG